MIFRLWTILVLGLAAMLGCSTAPAEQPQQRIVAIGDLHGDHAVWQDLVRAAGLVDGRGRWAGGRTILVQLGDVPDRGPDTLKILRQLMALQKDARKAGGRVIALIGNHEAMNVIGDLRYVDPGEYAAFVDRDSAARRDRVFAANAGDIARQYRQADPSLSDAAVRARWLQETPLGWVEHRLAWKPNGEIGRWVVKNPAVAYVHGNVFVHGGISAEYSRLPISEINSRVGAALANQDSSPGAIISDPLGPLWYRGLLGPDADIRPAPVDELTTVLTRYGARRIVVAHTPMLSGIGILQGGRLVRIDSGNSRYYGGRPSYLEIIGDRVIPHAVARSAK